MPYILETFDMGSDHNSVVVEFEPGRLGSIVLRWEGLTGTPPCTAIIECSNDTIHWDEMGGDRGGAVIETLDDDRQIWEFVGYCARFRRVAYTANGITGGTGYIERYYR